MTIWLLFIALLATAIGQSVVLTILPPLGRQVGMSELQVAIILSTSALVYALGSSIWGRLSQHLGRRRVLIIGLTGYTLGTLLFGSIFYLGMQGLMIGLPLFVSLLVTRSLQSTVMSATPPAALSYAVSMSAAHNRMATISRVTSANALGQILGPALGGALAGFGLLVPLYTIAIFTLLALILILLKLPDDRVPATPSTHSSTSASLRPPWLAVRYVIVAASLFCAMGMVQQSLGFFFIDTLGMTPIEAAQRVGLAAMTVAVFTLTVQLVIVQRMQWPAKTLLAAGLCALLCGYTLLAINHALVSIYVGMALLGVGMGLSYPASTTAATEACTPLQQGRISGLITGAPAMGFVIGPPVAALLYKQQSFYPFIASAVLISAMLLMHSLAGFLQPESDH